MIFAQWPIFYDKICLEDFNNGCCSVSFLQDYTKIALKRNLNGPAYQALFSDHGVDGDHVRVRKKFKIEVTVNEFGGSALLGKLVDVLEVHQLALGWDAKICEDLINLEWPSGLRRALKARV